MEIYTKIVVILLNATFFGVSFGRVYYIGRSEKKIQTNYGTVYGIVLGFPERARLQKVEAFLGWQYGTSRGVKLRFMPPSSSLERWFGATRFLMSPRPACPQPLVHERKLKKYLPKAFVEQLKRIAPNISKQQEECLTLNLYVPKGEEPPQCVACQCPLTVKHILLDCADFTLVRDTFYTASSMHDLFNHVLTFGNEFYICHTKASRFAKWKY